MTRARGDRSGFVALLEAVGRWLHPVSAYRRHSAEERQLQYRVGVVGAFCLTTAVVALTAAFVHVSVDLDVSTGPIAALGPTTLQAALVLVILSVFAPQAVFRTRNAALTKEVLSNPSTPIRPWRSTTITFDAVLVGAMLAGLYYDGALALLFFGLALIARTMFRTRHTLESDPNARFHNVTLAWTSAAMGGAAFLVVGPLAASVSTQGSIIPLILAAMVAMYVGLLFNAVERWANDDRTRWAFARDAVDTRRIVVALVSALIVWLVAVVGEWVGGVYSGNAQVAGSLTGLGIFVAAWLLLWFVSIRMWRRDALRSLALWSAHQARIVTRITDGSLSPELAARAALPIATRIAVSVFGATRALAVVDDGRGNVTQHLVAVNVYDNAAPPDPGSLATLPHLRLPLYEVPGHPNSSSITIADWLWIGGFMTRSRTIVDWFTQLATVTLLTPVIAEAHDSPSVAFDAMFDDVSHWPTLAAFEQAVDRMRERADRSPTTDSLLIGVYAIDDFGALAGGRFEHAAVAQVMRLALGHQDFAGQDVFVAYEEPGRIWVALGSGPIIRNGLALLRGLQQYINDHGAVPSARLDVDVHVSVSFGHASHQVDDFTYEGLMALAGERLTADQGARNPFGIDELLAYDIRPEDIIGQPDTPVTAVDVISLMRADHDSHSGLSAFTTTFVPIVNIDTGASDALSVLIGWQRSFGTLDLSDPRAFLGLVNRQPRLAADAVRVTVDRLRSVYAEADALGHLDLPVVVAMPTVLLQPEAGEFALPNLMTPALNRRECARTVVLVDRIPSGAGQALRLLSDRGLHIAVTSEAAAGADPGDLLGWHRWGIVFPSSVVQAPEGVDGLTVQQTVSAMATRDTRLIGIADERVDLRDLALHSIGWILDPATEAQSVAEGVDALTKRRPRPRA